MVVNSTGVSITKCSRRSLGCTSSGPNGVGFAPNKIKHGVTRGLTLLKGGT